MVAVTIRQALLLLAVALLPAIGEGVYLRNRFPWREPPAQEEVSVREARSWGDNVLWLDARDKDDFENGHVANAQLLNADDWDNLLPAVLNSWSPDRRIVVYCSQKSCDASKEVARRLRDEVGLKNVFVLKGGWEAWQESAK